LEHEKKKKREFEAFQADMFRSSNPPVLVKSPVRNIPPQSTVPPTHLNPIPPSFPKDTLPKFSEALQKVDKPVLLDREMLKRGRPQEGGEGFKALLSLLSRSPIVVINVKMLIYSLFVVLRFER